MEMADAEDFVVHEHDGLRLVDLYLEMDPFVRKFSVELADVGKWLVIRRDHENDFAIVLSLPEDVQEISVLVAQAESNLRDAEEAGLEFHHVARVQMLFEHKRFGCVHATQIDMRLFQIGRHAMPCLGAIFLPVGGRLGPRNFERREVAVPDVVFDDKWKNDQKGDAAGEDDSMMEGARFRFPSRDAEPNGIECLNMVKILQENII